MKYIGVLTVFMAMLGCQNVPSEPTPTRTPQKIVQVEDIRDPSGVVIRTYDHPDIERKSIELPK